MTEWLMPTVAFVPGFVLGGAGRALWLLGYVRGLREATAVFGRESDGG